MKVMKFWVQVTVAFLLIFLISLPVYAKEKNNREQKVQTELEGMQDHFKWWPTDAKPAPVKDLDQGGYWWWPQEPGEARPWGNRGYVYVYKIIFDYQEEELPAPEPEELRPSLLIKKIIKNVKIYYDYDKAVLRNDAEKILSNAVETLKRNPEASILITGNCDVRGSESYNDKLGRNRAETVERFILENGVAKERVKIVSRGKLDAIAPVTDILGMQKDRNAQFMVAEIEEVMIPYSGQAVMPQAKEISEGKFIVEEESKLESEIMVEQKEYIIQKGDTLWKIAEKELGRGYRWNYLYELNKDRIQDPNKLVPGKRIIIPIE
ncbi:MAG: OmpA family protein [Candidatus Omnitrophota bacterium]